MDNQNNRNKQNLPGNNNPNNKNNRQSLLDWAVIFVFYHCFYNQRHNQGQSK